MQGASGGVESIDDLGPGPSDEVELDFGAGPTRLPDWVQVLDLRPGGTCRVPDEGPVDWSQLDALPRCLTLEWSGPARGIIEAVAARRGIRFLYWYDAAR